MADFSSLAFELVKEVGKIAKKGLDHENAAQNLEMMENDLRPMLEDIQELARQLRLPANEIEKLKSIMREMREVHLHYSKLECWKCCLAPYYTHKINEADKSIEDFITRHVSLQTLRNVLELRHQHQTGTTTALQRQRTMNIDLETSTFPEFIEGLNSALMQTLKSRLMKNDGDRVLTLTGFAGSGKTILVLQLCLDTQLQGWFKGNVEFVSVGTTNESNNGEQLGRGLCEKWNDKKGLLVLDNVKPASTHVVEQCLRQIPSNSKILVISRVALPGIGRQVDMKPLEINEAIELLSRTVEPVGTTSDNPPDRDILRKVAECCGGFPVAITMIGDDLREKPHEFWEQSLRKWSQGQTVLDTHAELLDYLRNSLQDSREFQDISEFFMDLALFPKDAYEFIPVSALLDMWVELHNFDEDGNKAMTVVHGLTDMNLAARELHMRVIGSSDAENDVDNQFIRQHNILRELAHKCSKEQGSNFEMKRVIIIEADANDPRPQCFPQQPRQLINTCLASFKQSMPRQVAAPILSITTGQNGTPDLSHIHLAKAEVLVLNLGAHEYRLPKFMKKMKSLRVLIVTNYDSHSTQFGNFSLLRSLKALKRMRLQHVSVPCVLKLRNLLKLSLYSCEVKTAFENTSMDFSEAMPNLFELKIEDSADLVDLPAGICNIVNLKKLSITRSRNFSRLPQEIRKLKNLELLRINYCLRFEEMPESISELKSLTFLDISNCQNLRKLPDNIGQLQNLNKLYMAGCQIHELPDSVKDFKNLKTVICNEYTSRSWEHVKDSMEIHFEVKTLR